MRVICVIASQGAGSNYKKGKENARPIYLRGTIRSLLENKRGPDSIYISYNDMSEIGREQYKETKRIFTNEEKVKFIEQKGAKSQFGHIESIIRYICESGMGKEPDTNILFIDDDDMLGEEVIRNFARWYKNYYVERVSGEELAKHAELIYQDQPINSIILSKAKDNCISLENCGDCKVYLWHTNMLAFGNMFNPRSIDEVNEQLHISDIKEYWDEGRIDFPGTIIPLALAIVILNHMNWNENAAADVLFMTMLDNFIKKTKGYEIKLSKEEETEVLPGTRLMYRW